MKSKLTDQQRLDAFKRVEAGEAIADVARSIGVSTQNMSRLVQRRRERAQMPMSIILERARDKLSDEEKIEAVRRRLAGDSHAAIARDLGVSHQNISKLMLRRGLPPRRSRAE